MSPLRSGLAGAILGVFCTALLALALYRGLPVRPDDGPAFDPGRYYAVLLTSGQAYFAHVDRRDRRFLHLTNVYYIQTTVNPETKVTSNTLVKRGNEIHGPTEMLVSPDAIQYIEPVGVDSQVAKLIAEAGKNP